MKKKTNNKKVKPALSETQRWVLGVVLFAFAVFVLVAVVSYYFYWRGDQVAVRPGGGGVVTNPTGPVGARVAHWVVGQSFGVFGVVMPLLLGVLALRVIGLRPLSGSKVVLTGLALMVLGSLTLGFMFGERWGVFGTGAGGAHGIYLSELIVSYLGDAGTGLLLLLGWILLGVYITRRTIALVNGVGKGIYKGVGRVGDVFAGAPEDEEYEYEYPQQPSQQPEPAPEYEEEEPDERVIEIVRPPEPEPVAESRPMPMPVPDNMVVEFGQEAGDYIVGKRRAPNAGESRVIEVVQPRAGGELMAGGVVEAAAQGAMKVVVPGQSDVQLDDDEIDSAIYDPTKELSKYQIPPVEILEDHSVEVRVTEDEIYENRRQIETTLLNFGIKIDKIKATIGPTVTLYEIIPSAGVKIAKIKNLEDDIALSLKALGIRIIAPMPGKGTVGIEVPNKDKEVVSMYSVVKTRRFQESKAELPVVLGKTISNETFMIDLTQMPHLLVAGATGQGKSVGLNAIITSLLYRKHPAELKFVFVDPKRVELSLYSKLEKHFLAKMESEDEAILTDTQKVVYTLNSLCELMSKRYDMLRAAGVKKISEYNEKFRNRRLNPNKGHEFMPYIVVVVDEFADLIMTAGREIETPLTRLAQLARAVGIHLVIATQRPDVKVITGLIKANFPARIAFRVMSMVDSRTIIDQPGANQLIGRGDMLISLNGELTRVQCAFIDTPEIERVTEFIGNQRGYAGPFTLPDYHPESVDGERVAFTGDADPMLGEVARWVVQNQQGSTSSIQRRFSIGYNRAGRIMDQLEEAGVVGRADGSKPREVLLMDVNSLDSIL
jgi:S-DNA-T family DNA segregation ATPase FtsK/SpoIIIE